MTFFMERETTPALEPRRDIAEEIEGLPDQREFDQARLFGAEALNLSFQAFDGPISRRLRTEQAAQPDNNILYFPH